MKIQSKNSKINIDPDHVIGFYTTCDPFKSNNHSLVIYMDNGTQQNVTFFSLDELKLNLDNLIEELKRVKQYKIIVNGMPQIDYNKRTQVKLKEKQGLMQ